MRRLPRPQRRYRALRDPGKKPKGAKDGWIGVIVERDEPSDRRSPGTMYVYGKQGYLGDFRTNENGFMGGTRGDSSRALHIATEAQKRRQLACPDAGHHRTGPAGGQTRTRIQGGRHPTAPRRPSRPARFALLYHDKRRRLPPRHAYHASGTGFHCFADCGVGGSRCPGAITKPNRH